MPQGVEIASQNRLQIIEEVTPGTANTGGTPIIVTDIKADFQHNEDWKTQRPDGYNADLYSAILREWCTVSGNLAPDYKMMRHRVRMMCGAPVASGTAGGVTTEEYRLPEQGRVDRKMMSMEWGLPSRAFRAAYGLMQSLSINSARNGDTDGSVSMCLRKPDANVSMIGSAANEVQTITLTGVSGAISIVVPGTPLGNGGNVTLTPGQTASSLQAALAALPAIGSAANVGVIGTSTTSASGGDQTGLAGFSSSFGNAQSANAFDNSNVTSLTLNRVGGYGDTYVQCDLGSTVGAKVISSVTIRRGGGSGLHDFSVEASNDNFATLVPIAVSRYGITETDWNNATNNTMQFPVTTGAAYRYWRVRNMSSLDDATVAEVELLVDGVSSNGTYSIEFKGALANTNINSITSSGSGVTIATTTQGGNGTTVPLDPRPILPAHWTVTRSNTLAGLSTAAVMPTIEQHGLSFADLVNPHWVEDGASTYKDHVDGETNVSMTLALALDTAGDCADLYAKAHNYLATPQWFEAKADCPDNVHAFYVAVYGSVRENVPYGTDNNVYRRTFTISRKMNPVDGFSTRIILKFPTS